MQFSEDLISVYMVPGTVHGVIAVSRIFPVKRNPSLEANQKRKKGGKLRVSTLRRCQGREGGLGKEGLETEGPEGLNMGGCSQY